MYILGTSAMAHWDLLNLLCTRLEVRIGLVWNSEQWYKRQGIARNGVGMLQSMDANAGHLALLDYYLYSVCFIFSFLEMG